jgi:hypothetical protein
MKSSVLAAEASIFGFRLGRSIEQEMGYMLSWSDSGKVRKRHLHRMGFLSVEIEKRLDWLSNK